MSRQSILTKYVAPTNTREAKIKAIQSGWSEKRECKSVTIPYPYELNLEEGHAKAAKILAEKLGWKGRFVSSSLGAWSNFAYCFSIDDGTAFETE